MNRYQIENAAYKIDGYYSPCPSKPGGNAAEFERARQECIKHLRRQLADVESLTLEQFARYKLRESRHVV